MFFLKNYFQAYFFAFLLFTIILLAEIQTESWEEIVFIEYLLKSIFPKAMIYAIPLAFLMFSYGKFGLNKSIVVKIIQVFVIFCVSLTVTLIQKILEFHLGNWERDITILSFIKTRFVSTWFGLNIFAIIYGIVVISLINFRKNITLNNQLKSMSINAVRNQLEHHFLFNNLNTLYSLIDINNEKALSFLQDLSELYRYLLENIDNQLVSISAEMEIVQKYINLVHERFGENLKFKIKIYKTLDKDKFIPPLAIYNLLENVIKHNIINKSHKIVCSIEIRNNYIVVSNNIFKKRKTGNNNKGTGLNSLQEIYYLLAKRKIKIFNTENRFSVEIPIIELHEIIDKKVTNENFNH